MAQANKKSFADHPDAGRSEPEGTGALGLFSSPSFYAPAAAARHTGTRKLWRTRM